METEEKQLKIDNFMMDKAFRTSKEAYCKRLKVGAIFSKNNRALIDGYNGTIKGADNMCEEPTGNILTKEQRCFSHMTDIKNSKTTKEFNENCKKALNHYSIEPLEIINAVPCTMPGDFTPQDYTIEYTINEMRTSDYVVHAEQNIIYYAAKEGISLDGGTLYITHSPCKQCSKAIIASGIKRVVYSRNYRDENGIEFLKNNGVIIDRI